MTQQEILNKKYKHKIKALEKERAEIQKKLDGFYFAHPSYTVWQRQVVELDKLIKELKANIDE